MSNKLEFPSISNVKPSISIEIPCISIENLGFLGTRYFESENLKILRFSHLNFEILGISSKIPSISKTWNFD